MQADRIASQMRPPVLSDLKVWGVPANESPVVLLWRGHAAEPFGGCRGHEPALD